jgi:O-acetyl-ADP-ribose deacetylase (regulator of RNase III)
MHITYQQVDKVVQKESAKVKKDLEKNKDNGAAIRTAIAEALNLENAYGAEQKQITNIMARYGSFQKQNAIMSCCDAIKEYLQLAISNAARDAANTTNANNEFYAKKKERLEVSF